MAPAGRRPGESGTREAILEAARSTFGEVGYERATIRAIAAAAGVDPALVHHYFGTKEDLFVAAIEVPINPAEAARAILGSGLDGAGERIVRYFLSVWDEHQDALTGVLRAALTNDRAATMIRGFAETALVGAVAGLLDDPNAKLRATLVGSHLAGLAFLRYGLRLQPLASAHPDEIAALVGPPIQSYLTP